MTVLLKPKDLRKYGIPPSTAARMRKDGSGPAFIKRGRSIFYDPQDVAEWLESLKVRARPGGSLLACPETRRDA